MKINSPKKIAGVTLIEVMISVLIMGIGMLGIAAMQTTALRNNQGALRRTEVVMQTYTILDAMRANRDVALIGGYNTTNMLCTAPSGSGLPDRDRALWLTGLKMHWAILSRPADQLPVMTGIVGSLSVGMTAAPRI